MAKSNLIKCSEIGCQTMCNENRFGKCPAHKPRVSCEAREGCTRGKKKGSLYCKPHASEMQRRTRDE